jgi:hypothetical protein
VTDEALNLCLDLLAGMLSPSQEWTEAVASVYSLSMREWDDQVALCACQHAALNLKWRPAPVELRQIAIDLHAPTPPVGVLIEEARKIIRRYMPGKDRSAAAAISCHPLTCRVVDHLGGWDAIGLMDCEELPLAFARSLPSQVADWHQQEALTLLGGTPEIRPSLPSAPRRAARGLESIRGSLAHHSTWNDGGQSDPMHRGSGEGSGA